MRDVVVRAIRNVNGDSPHVEIECELPDGSTFTTRAASDLLQEITNTLEALASERIILSDNERIGPLDEVINETPIVSPSEMPFERLFERLSGVLPPRVIDEDFADFVEAIQSDCSQSRARRLARMAIGLLWTLRNALLYWLRDAVRRRRGSGS
jgi:hypothetical protein